MKSHKQPTASRKPPIMSVEEELAELLADPTLRPSITFLGLRPHTEPVSDTDSVPAKSTSFGVPKLGFGTPKPAIDAPQPRPAAPRKLKRQGLPRYERPKPVAARQVQDGHSHSEHAMYTTLWDASEPYSAEARVVTIGFGAMSRIVRLSLNNCRLNIRSLIRKLAVEEWKAAECERKIGKTYLIYNTNAISIPALARNRSKSRRPSYPRLLSMTIEASTKLAADIMQESALSIASLKVRRLRLIRQYGNDR